MKNSTMSVLIILMIVMLVTPSTASITWGVSNTASTLSLPVVNPVSSGSSGSSGGSGSSGVITDEPFSNIASSDRKDNDLYAGRTTTYLFKGAVYQIDIDATNNENDITAKVEYLKDKSAKTTEPPRKPILYFNAYVGTQRFNTAQIYFTADQPAILVRWNPATNQWIELETTAIDSNHYRATTTGFSNFAIVLNEPPQQPEVYKPEPTQAVSQATTLPTSEQPTPEPTMQTPGFMGLLSLIGLVTVSLYIRRK